MNKKLKKKLFKLLDKYGIFSERQFIRKEYRNDMFKDFLKLLEELN